ncbi:hypothetical protein ANCCAN_14135 [Ancylostoma caninum]|uniref:Uncharacterized protein n=1 Tax=Ancylostoma caninum TaxID=29170 RepID=A0A368GA94_ANCCA|nr:hypothetical protein ANCCAN_14135 [Ancylostoma caninum]
MKKWRENGLGIAFYLDDGIIFGASRRQCSRATAIVNKTSKQQVGTLPAKSASGLRLTSHHDIRMTMAISREVAQAQFQD